MATTASTDDVRVERAQFDGMLLATLSYGAMLMLYLQLMKVLLVRPKRGKMFWGIVVYSTALFTFCTLAAGGKIAFSEYIYVDSRFDQNERLSPWTPNAMAVEHASSRGNIMSQACTTLVPWFGDILMLYRVLVVWNHRWWLVVLPLLIYLARIGMSLPLLIANTQLFNDYWQSKGDLYGTVFYALCVALNIIATCLITLRLVTLRKKLEVALGKLHASYYTSKFTILVESGAFFTLWGIIYLATRSQNHWSQTIFVQSYPYMIGITRMLIVLRMAQNQAWTRDTVTAANNGIMDWQVSSAHSIPQHDMPSPFANRLNDLEMKVPNSPGESKHTLASTLTSKKDSD